MLISKRLQKIISMAMERQKVIERLMSKGENLDDGFICHMCKVILWFGKDESWYETLASDIRKLGELTLKPNAKKIPREMFIKYLFDIHCENKTDFQRTLLLVKAEFEDEIGSNGFKYPKAREWNIDKVWNQFLGFRNEILDRLEEKDPIKMVLSLKRNELKKLCEKYFKNIS